MNSAERVQMAMAELKKILSSEPIPYLTEGSCQQKILDMLQAHNVSVSDEHSIESDIIDFFFPRSGIALEVKAMKNWSKLEVYRQCERYLRHDDVNALLLVTAKAQGMPDQVNGKPVDVFYLGANIL